MKDILKELKDKFDIDIVYTRNIDGGLFMKEVFFRADGLDVVRKVSSTHKNFGHFRRVFTPKGGKTEVVFKPKGRSQTYFGEAKCSDDDNFNYRNGRSIAIGRAYKAFLKDQEVPF